MEKKKSTKIVLAIAGVLVVVLAALAVKFFILDAIKLEVTDSFEGITWDLNIEQAKRVLEREGYKFETSHNPTKVQLFFIEEFAGYDDISGTGSLVSFEEGCIENIYIDIKISENDLSEKEFDKFATAVMDAYESEIGKPVEHEGVYIYSGANSTVEIAYFENSEIMIIFSPPEN